MIKRRNILAALASVPLATCVALGAASGSAQAATMDRPSAAMTFASPRVAAGTSPVLTFLTTGTPAASVIYLERTSGTGQAWQPVARVSATSGTVRAPADPAGTWEYRILVTDGGKVVAASAPEALTVTGTASGSGSGGDCSACDVAKTAVQWLKPFVVPVLAYVVQQEGPAILAALGWIFGF
jgi:hypothetical protein